jgi:hypothetical protein
MRLKRHVLLIPAVLAISLTACRENPVLVEKREKQKVEITRLNGELSLLEEKLKNMPPDVSDDLAKAKIQTEEQAAEVARLETEITALEARKRALQREFDAYRAKYQLK